MEATYVGFTGFFAEKVGEVEDYVIEDAPTVAGDKEDFGNLHFDVGFVVLKAMQGR